MSYHVSFDVTPSIRAGAVGITAPVFGAPDSDYADEYLGEETCRWKLGDVMCSGSEYFIFMQGDFAKSGFGSVEETTQEDLDRWQAYARSVGRPEFADFLAKLKPEEIHASW